MNLTAFHPYCCCAAGLRIVRVPGYTRLVDGFTAYCWVFKKTMPIQEELQWNVTVVAPNCVRIRRPAIGAFEKQSTFWADDALDFKDKDKNKVRIKDSNDEATKRAETAQEVEITNEPRRHYVYYDYVLPLGKNDKGEQLWLDNRVLSGETPEVKKDGIKVKDGPLKGFVMAWGVFETDGTFTMMPTKTSFLDD